MLAQIGWIYKLRFLKTDADRIDPYWYSKPKVTGATCVAMKRVAA
jgi:hypothetical protein